MKKTREQAIEELSLMLMYLTRFPDDNEFYKFIEASWKGYDFEALSRLEEKDFLYQPKKSKRVYLSETGKEQARKLLQDYSLSDQPIHECFEFRSIRQEEADQAVAIEQICFPPNEACSEKHMKERIAKAPNLFLVAVDKETGKLAGFLNGLSTNETEFRDEFFLDAELYDPEGKRVMLLGLDVLPEYRNRGLARELVYQYARRERENGRNRLVLTCLQAKVKMYKKLGFLDDGIANSTWGGEEWHQMSCVIGM